MVTDFVFENLTLQESITLGQEPDFDYLFEPGGVDWGSVPADHNTYNYPGQVGSSISSTKIKDRDITINGYVYYWLSDEELAEVPRGERAEYCYDKIKEKKEVLSRIINPVDFVKITVGDYYITGKPGASVKYGTEEEKNNMYFCSFLVTVYCNNPMFKKNTKVQTAIGGSIPLFHFPLIIPRDKGIVMGVRQNYLMLAVENEGNVAIGGKIIFKANGEVKNPSVENLATGEVIKVNKIMEKGEVITVNTVDGKERGITGVLHGVESSYLKYWNYDNVWFKFGQGTTLIGYATDSPMSYQ